MIALVAALGAMTLATGRCRNLGRARPSGRPAMTVIVPARNEAHALPRLLDDLRAQREVDLEVVVVDDDSTDGTAEHARRAGVRVIEAGGHPPGWNPKVWALDVGARSAARDVLVFVDADVRLSPLALAAVAARLERHSGLVSVAPYHTPRRPVESLSAPWNVVTVAAGQRLAVGSLIAIGRRDYDLIGGHAARPATIVDDIELAKSAHRHGVPTALFAGEGLVTVRSYPRGLREIIDGWTKNTSAGASSTTPLAALVVAAWTMASLSPLVHVLRGDVRRAAFAWAVTGWHLRWLCRRFGAFDSRVVGVGAPLLGAFFAAVNVRSLWLRARGRPVRWKDRAMTPDGVVVP
jgi:4,4'-diaponeurosporenoate glycosyltransferase